MKRAPMIVLVAAVAFSIFLQTLVPGEVFVSGDSAVKAIMMRQLAGGALHADLRLAPASWARPLWEAGLYPLTPHHVETINGKRYIQWPLAFPIITAPFYGVGGYRGALLVPLVSTWAVWLAFFVSSNRMGLRPGAIATGLGGLAFATHLTYYSAAYWEHTIAVALVFGGACVLLGPGSLDTRRAALGAMTASSSVWFREELAFLVGLIGIAVLRRWPRGAREGRHSSSAMAACIVGLLVPLVALVAWNQLIYGDIRGVHVLMSVNGLRKTLGRPDCRTSVRSCSTCSSTLRCWF